MANRPHLEAVRKIIDTILLDPNAAIMTSAEGEPITEEEPTRDRNTLVDDCYACDLALIEVYSDGQPKGNILVLPYEAEDAEEVIADHHVNDYIENIITQLNA